MTPLVTLIVSYLLLYKYSAMFGVIFLAGAIFPLPINTVLIAIGAFSSQHFFDFKTSFIVAFLANTLGDLVPYYFFRVYGHDLIKEKFIEKYSYFTKLERYMETHAGLSIIISRIIGLFGQPVNFLAGYAKMPFSKFFIFDAIGNFLFVLIFIVLGYFVGDDWVTISGFVENISTLILVGVIMWFIYVIIKKHGKSK